MDGWLEGAVEGVCKSWFEKQKGGRLSAFSNSSDVHKLKWATWTLHSSHTDTERLMKKKHPPSSPHTFNCWSWANSKGAHRWAQMSFIRCQRRGLVMRVWWAILVPQWGTTQLDLYISKMTSVLCLTKPMSRAGQCGRTQTCKHTHKAILNWLTDNLTYPQCMFGLKSNRWK